MNTAFEYQISVRALQQQFFVSIHRDNYKGGIFKSQIKETTPVLTSFDILISSPELTSTEKATLQVLRQQFINMENTDWRGKDIDLLLMSIPLFERLPELFQEDMKKRGQYVAPMMRQVPDPATGAVRHTSTMDSDGNITNMEGGIAGVIPGAPLGFDYSGSTFIEIGNGGSEKKNSEEGTKTASKGKDAGKEQGLGSKVGEKEKHGDGNDDGNKDEKLGGSMVSGADTG